MTADIIIMIINIIIIVIIINIINIIIIIIIIYYYKSHFHFWETVVLMILNSFLEARAKLFFCNSRILSSFKTMD